MKVLVYIGEMGSGKSYHAERDAADLGYAFIERDDLGAPVMQDAIKGFKLITRSAYKRAKEENDERFMIERDEARIQLRAAREAAALTQEEQEALGLVLAESRNLLLALSVRSAADVPLKFVERLALGNAALDRLLATTKGEP